MRTQALAVAAAMLLLSGTACRRDEPPPTPGPRPYTIALFQSVDSPTAAEVRRGILDALASAGLKEGRDVSVRVLIAANDMAEVQRIARSLASGEDDLVVPMSTQALQAALLAGVRKPIVFSAVAAPSLVGAGRTADDHLGHVTGVVSTGPIRQTVALIREVLPRARRLGCLWTSSEINSEYYMDLARESASELGFETVAAPVLSAHEIPTVVQGLLNRKVDALFPMSDNTINSAFDAVSRAAEDSGTPLFGSFLKAVELGACAALGLDFYDMGLKTGGLILRVKDGESPAGIPFQSVGQVKLRLNLEAARKQGVVFSRGLLERADQVLGETAGRPGSEGPLAGPERRPSDPPQPAPR